jgi:TetR/AcrR family transcriptional repressor of bet genes
MALADLAASKQATIKPRTQAENRDYRRQSLLEATIITVANLGVEGATIAKICAQAGASRGMSAHYFKSKEDLLAACLEYMFEQAINIKREISEQQDLDCEERIRRCACSSFTTPSFAREILAAWQAFISASRYTERYKVIIQQHNERTFELYLALFNQQKAQLKVPPGVAIQGLMALLEGLWSNIASQQNSISSDNAKLACDCYIRGCFN